MNNDHKKTTSTARSEGPILPGSPLYLALKHVAKAVAASLAYEQEGDGKPVEQRKKQPPLQ